LKLLIKTKKNKNMKIIIKTILRLFLIIFFFNITPVYANNYPVNAYFFNGDGCPHCALEKQFLFEELKIKYPNLQIYEFEIYNNRESGLLLQKVANELKVGVDGVPFLVIGNQNFIGFTEGISSKIIEERVKTCSLEFCPDSIASIIGIETFYTPIDKFNNSNSITINEEKPKEKIIKLPLIGKINVMKFSLPVLTIIMGALDGFNPCAMWVLLFLISLLIGIKDRKKMWILGIIFIIVSASVYFLFMSAWLNLILFLGFVVWVRLLIGILALLGGSYSIKEFLFNKNSGCKVVGDEKRQKTFSKMKSIVQKNNFWIAVGGIIVLAFAVNLVELICSAGLPAIYTQVLALNEMTTWNYYLYILLYVFFFMLDDLIIFFIAMLTLEMTGITTKYSKISRLIGGLIMLAIGLMLIFKPSWLMFG